MSADFFNKKNEMLKAVEAKCREPGDMVWVARMCGYLEAQILDLPDTPEVREWLDRVIRRAKNG